jgi:Uma2 family endonuclease
MATLLERSKKTRTAANGKGEPVWDIALWYPLQGDWTEEMFLELDNDSEPRLMELNDGFLEVLPMPDMVHQDIAQFLLESLQDFIRVLQIGRVYIAPLPVKLWAKQLREPDVVFLKTSRIKDKRKPPKGADLVMEVVSRGADARKRDLTEKRRVYAKARIPEYWIVDPKTKRITVLTLSARSYKVHGVFKEGTDATSKLLKGFKVAVSEVFAAGDEK